MDWHKYRLAASNAAFTSASEPAIYNAVEIDMQFPVQVLFNEKTEFSNDAGLVEYKPTAKIQRAKLPITSPSQWDRITINSTIWAVDFWETAKNGLEYIIYLKEQGYGSAY